MNQQLIQTSAVMPLARATGLFVSLATVQQATNTQDALGQVDLTNTGFATIAGCSLIPCMRAPYSINNPKADEKESPTMVESMNEFHVLLNDWYPQIPEADASTGDLRVILDGVAHIICGVESDSQFTQTRLRCKQEAV